MKGHAMITLQRITTADAELYHYVENLLVQSFPDNEYRPLEQLRDYTDHKKAFCNNVILHENNPIGLLTYWDFGTYCYIEHFAIDTRQRNGGYGRESLQLLCRLLERPVVLEVEMPDNELAERRIRFYQRQDFRLWTKPYKQPPYKAGDSFLPMYLMAYGNLQAERDFESVVSDIHREVYNCTAPC